MELNERSSKLRININYFSDVGAARSMNQDNYYIQGRSNLLSKSSRVDSDSLSLDELTAIAVFDGMGGGSAGEKASLIAAECMDCFIDAMNAELSRESVATASQSYYRNFMDRLYDYLGEDNSLCGTTFAGVFLNQDKMIPVWLGDSRIYILRAGRVYRVSKDHSLAQSKVDNGSMTEEEAKSTRDWHVLTSYMGQSDARFSIERVVNLQPGDKIFLCSDGITDGFSDEEIEKILRLDSREVIKKLLLWAQKKGSDNCTAILVDVINDSKDFALAESIRRIKEWHHTFRSKVKK